MEKPKCRDRAPTARGDAFVLKHLLSKGSSSPESSPVPEMGVWGLCSGLQRNGKVAKDS